MDPALILEYQKETGSAFEDSLTGLFNHGFFHLILEREIERVKRYGTSFTLALLDVDEFALFNERHGALTGDLLLRSIASTIRNTIRQADVAARYHGDSFAIVMADTDPASACKALERIQQKVTNLQNNDVSVSVGIAACPQNADTKSSLLETTVAALDQARKEGSNSTFYFSETKENEVKREHPSVLIVDDEPLNLKLLEALMVPLKYELHKATNGLEALEIVDSEDIDLVLLDVMMPGMDGFEVCRKIKTSENTRMIPVVMVTALADIFCPLATVILRTNLRVKAYMILSGV